MLAIAAIFGIGASSALANEWHSWRGPSANGSIDLSGAKFPTEWEADETEWSVKLPGKGSSSPIVVGDRIFLSSPDAGQDSVLAYDLKGKRLWQTKLGSSKNPKHKKLGSSCNSSPVTDGEGIFVYFKSGNFAALETDGTIRWQKNLTEEYGAEKLYWDQGSSPVIVGDLVILSRLHAGKSWIAGFDKKDGKVRWMQPRDYKVPAENDNGYTTPVVFDHGGKKALLVWGADHLTAHAADSGKVLWSCSGFNPDGTGFWPAIATPVIEGGIAVIPVGRDDRQGQARVHGIRIDGEAEGDVTKSHRVWKRDDVGVFVSSPTVYKGKVYLLRHRGGIVCLDPKSGKTIWEEELPRSGSSYYSSPVIANGVLYAAREDGVVFSAKVDGGFDLLGENEMGEQIIATPVPVNGRLLLRGASHLFCVK